MLQMVNFNDAYYIEKVLHGDKAAFSWLVNRYSDMVYSIALKILKNAADAEDLSQDVFISAFQSLPDYRGNSKFSTWLYRITFNKAISMFRKTKYEIITDDEKHLESRGGREYLNQGLTDDEEKIKILESVIRQLPEDEQLMIMLHYFEDQSIDEISTITRISTSNVKVKLFRIRKKMKEMIEKIDRKIILLTE